MVRMLAVLEFDPGYTLRRNMFQKYFNEVTEAISPLPMDCASVNARRTFPLFYGICRTRGQRGGTCVEALWTRTLPKWLCAVVSENVRRIFVIENALRV